MNNKIQQDEGRPSEERDIQGSIAKFLLDTAVRINVMIENIFIHWTMQNSRRVKKYYDMPITAN